MELLVKYANEDLVTLISQVQADISDVLSNMLIQDISSLEHEIDCIKDDSLPPHFNKDCVSDYLTLKRLDDFTRLTINTKGM